jgi:hypothetical protein
MGLSHSQIFIRNEPMIGETFPHGTAFAFVVYEEGHKHGNGWRKAFVSEESALQITDFILTNLPKPFVYEGVSYRTDREIAYASFATEEERVAFIGALREFERNR